MKSSYAILALSLGAMGQASPVSHRSKTPGSQQPVCKNIVLNIQAAANNTAFPAYPDSTGPNTMYKYLQTFNPSTLPQKFVSGTYKISAIYCEPSVKVSGREGTVQLLLHGLSSTKEYWTGISYSKPNFVGEYSWVSHAASQGYATLAIDNLGNGNSDRPDPVSVVQPPLQLSVLHSIITGLRAGSLKGIPKYDKVVMATHSYGSVLGRLIAQIWPTNGADAYILTAASGNLTGIQAVIGDFQARSASAVDSRFRHLAPAYVSVARSAVRDTIYGPDGSFDPKIEAWDAESPHVFAVGEIAFFQQPAPTSFTGPVMVLTGRQDQIVCGNGNITSNPNCGNGPTSNPVMYTKSLFTKASNFEVYIPDNLGHNINTHYAATEAFGAAHSWLQSVGF